MTTSISTAYTLPSHARIATDGAREWPLWMIHDETPLPEHRRAQHFRYAYALFKERCERINDTEHPLSLAEADELRSMLDALLEMRAKLDRERSGYSDHA